MRRLVALVAVVGLGTGACLSTPGPAGDDDGRDDAAVTDGDLATDAGVDGSGQPSCRPAGALPAGTAWPPPGINVRQLQIADLDVDGVNDLVVTVAPGVARGAGPSKVYVLYGPVDRMAPKYHASIDVGTLGAVIPWATTLARVDAGPCLDLIVAGPPVMGSNTSFAAVWAHGGGVSPWSGPPARSALTREPPPGPLMAVLADLTIDTDLDLAVADLDSVDVFVGARVDALPGALNVPRPICNMWGNINALVRQPAAGGRERLLAFGHYRYNTIAIDDLGTIQVSDNCASSSAPITRGSAAIDLDGQAPLDLFSGGGGIIGAHLLAGVADPVTPVQGAMACTDTPRGSDAYIEGFAAGHLGGFPTPEVVIIDHDDQDGMSYACLLDAVDANGTRVLATAVNELPLGPGTARSVVVGDVDGKVRAWILMNDGVARCLERGAAANLQACE